MDVRTLSNEELIQLYEITKNMNAQVLGMKALDSELKKRNLMDDERNLKEIQ